MFVDGGRLGHGCARVVYSFVRGERGVCVCVWAAAAADYFRAVG